MGTMADVRQWEKEPTDNDAHDSSQVLTGLIFDIFLQLLQSYWKERPAKIQKKDKETSARQAGGPSEGSHHSPGAATVGLPAADGCYF